MAMIMIMPVVAFGFSTPDIVLILVVALVLFGPKNLPKMARTIGKSMEEFRRTAREIENEIMREPEPKTPASPPPPPELEAHPETPDEYASPEVSSEQPAAAPATPAPATAPVVVADQPVSLPPAKTPVATAPVPSPAVTIAPPAPASVEKAPDVKPPA